MKLDLEEQIYKYYIHHGVSVYLVASKDIYNDKLWQVTVKNLYTPGKDLGFGSSPNSCNNCYSIGCRNNYCVCPKGNSGKFLSGDDKITGKICKNNQIEQKIPGINTGMNRSTVLKMTTNELQKLMDKLDTSNGINIHQGNVILY